jgi:2-polyprenyl-3-methyl-5-hydroxy-6-metoxy-1,4-benzoquinol methylase
VSYTKKKLKHGVVRVDPLPNQDELKKYYESNYYQESDGFKTTYDIEYSHDEIDHKILESKIAIEALRRFFSNGLTDVSLLEFGCGEGFFLDQAVQIGWSAQGMDFSQFGIEKWHPHLIKFCSFGDCYDRVEESINEKKVFDICVLRNVLEHVIDPVLF